MRKILILLLITSITFGQNINPNFVDGTIMFKFEIFVVAKDTSNKILDGIGIKEEIEDYPILSDIFRNNSRINHNRKLIQDKVAQVDLISKRAQDLVANFHQFLYEDD